ncbi:MAG TPA: hypothetical protein PK724_04275, partial [Pseudomonadales bacterium]|nr:hypothetical protein [Pseudomonadales bacterium]
RSSAVCPIRMTLAPAPRDRQTGEGPDDRADVRRRVEGVEVLVDVLLQLPQSERNALNLAVRQQRASVQLIRALGGGWSESEAPSP